jgi:hypothetical protein
MVKDGAKGMNQGQEKRARKESVSQTDKGYILALGKERGSKGPELSNNICRKDGTSSHQLSQGQCFCVEVNYWKRLADL